MLFKVKIMHVLIPSPLVERLRAWSTSTKTPVLAIIFKVPILNVIRCVPKPPYLKGIVTYEDDQTAIFQSDLAKIHFPFSRIFFFFYLHLQLSWWRHDNATSTRIKLKLKMDVKNIFETSKPILKASYDESLLRFLHATRSRWATRALELDLR
jgi:hypothetical protein